MRIAAAVLLIATAAAARTRSDMNFVPPPKDTAVELRVEIDNYLESQTQNGQDFDMRAFGARGRIFLAPERAFVSPRFGFEYVYLDFESADPAVPDDVTDTSVAFGMPLTEIGDFLVEFTVGVGFGGDEPFEGDGWYGLASITAKGWIDDKNLLSFGLDYDGNRVFAPDIPLPVFIWTRVWTREFRTTIGFPFVGFTWEPNEKFTFELSYLPPTRTVLTATYRLPGNFELIGRFRGASFGFAIDNNPQDNRRTFYTEERLEFGVRWKITEKAVLEFVAAWVYERRFSSGYQIIDADTTVRTDATAAFAIIFEFGF